MKKLRRIPWFLVSCLTLAGLACGTPIGAQGPVIRHSDYQLDTTDPSNTSYVTPLPFRLRGVVLNDTEDWLDPTEHFDNQTMFFLGGQAEFILQAVDLDGTPYDPYPGPGQSGSQDPLSDDFGGTFIWIGQNYGNLPFVPDQDLAYIDQNMAGVPGETRPIWYDELDRNGFWRPGRDPSDPAVVRAGDLIEVRAPVNGLVFNGKHNVNERHTIDVANDFEVIILEKNYGLPAPASLTLDALKDADDLAIYDPTRQSGGERFQGSLVQLRNVAFETLTAGSTLQSDTTYTVVDGSGRSLEVYVGLDPTFGSTLIPSGRLHLTGVLDQKSPSGTDGYRLLLLEPDDLQAALVGDFDGDSVYGVGDIDLLTRASASGENELIYDLNGDWLVNQNDVRVWTKDLAQIWIGDTNVDGEFNTSDLVIVLERGKYETDTAAVWSEGDWTGDGRFNTGDFVAALQDGGYELGSQPVVTVPEPCGTLLCFVGWFGVVASFRRIH